jgi:hypothetical protein
MHGFGERGLHARIRIPSEKALYSLNAIRGFSHLFGLSHRYNSASLIPLKKNTLPLTKVRVTKEGDNVVIKGKKIEAYFARNKAALIHPQFPSRPVRWLLKISLLFLDCIQILFKFSNRLLDKITNNKTTRKAHERLFESLHLREPKNTTSILHKLSAKYPSLAPKRLVRLLSHPSVSPYLKKIMKGANVRLRGHKAQQLFTQLTHLKNAHQRPSSHPHKPNTSHGLETPLFGELLFWKDSDGHVRLQFEAHSLKSPFKIYCHAIDFLRYKLQGRQQGLFGASKRTDAFPIDIKL